MLQHKQLVENEYKQLVQYAIYTAAALCSMWHAAAKQVEQYISAAQAIGAAQAIYISGYKQLEQYISGPVLPALKLPPVSHLCLHPTCNGHSHQLSERSHQQDGNAQKIEIWRSDDWGVWVWETEALFARYDYQHCWVWLSKSVGRSQFWASFIEACFHLGVV